MEFFSDTLVPSRTAFRRSDRGLFLLLARTKFRMNESNNAETPIASSLCECIAGRIAEYQFGIEYGLTLGAIRNSDEVDVNVGTRPCAPITIGKNCRTNKRERPDTKKPTPRSTAQSHPLRLACGERPRNRCAAKNADKCASVHVTIPKLQHHAMQLKL